jgi:cytochrome c oxidase cbb3-type subunit III
MRRRLPVLAVLALSVACESTKRPAADERSGPEEPPAGELTLPYVQTSTFQAGERVAWPIVENPYADRGEEGRRYYLAFNCAGCHGVRGGGGIGPPFAVPTFIYGNAPGNIFQSIVQGRPHGMPAYGGKAPDEVLWMIAAYVESLSRPHQRDGGGG